MDRPGLLLFAIFWHQIDQYIAASVLLLEAFEFKDPVPSLFDSLVCVYWVSQSSVAHHCDNLQCSEYSVSLLGGAAGLDSVHRSL